MMKNHKKLPKYTGRVPTDLHPGKLPDVMGDKDGDFVGNAIDSQPKVPYPYKYKKAKRRLL